MSYSSHRPHSRRGGTLLGAVQCPRESMQLINHQNLNDEFAHALLGTRTEPHPNFMEPHSFEEMYLNSFRSSFIQHEQNRAVMLFAWIPRQGTQYGAKHLWDARA